MVALQRSQGGRKDSDAFVIPGPAVEAESQGMAQQYPPIDEPFDADQDGGGLSRRNEVEERVIEALKADAETSALAEGLSVEAEGGAVTLRGEIDDLDDEDAVLDIAERVAGVTGAVSRLRLRGSPEE